MNCILKKITIGSVFTIAAAQLHALTVPIDISLNLSPGNPVSAGSIVTLTANVRVPRATCNVGNREVL